LQGTTSRDTSPTAKPASQQQQQASQQQTAELTLADQAKGASDNMSCDGEEAGQQATSTLKQLNQVGGQVAGYIRTTFSYCSAAVHLLKTGCTGGQGA